MQWGASTRAEACTHSERRLRMAALQHPEPVANVGFGPKSTTRPKSASDRFAGLVSESRHSSHSGPFPVSQLHVSASEAEAFFLLPAEAEALRTVFSNKTENNADHNE